MWVYLLTVSFCICLWKALQWLKTSWSSYRAISMVLAKFPLPDEHHWFFGVAHVANDGDTYINVIQKNVEKYQIKAMTAWMTWLRPAIVVVHPEPLKDILKASQAVAKKSHDYDLIKPWIGEGLLVSNGRKWERSRRLLTPAFHFDVLKPYVKIYNDVADLLLENISHLSVNKSVDVCPLVSRATLDTMLRCAMSYIDEGVQGMDKDEHPFCEAIRRLKEILMRRWGDPLEHNDVLFSLKSYSKEFKQKCDYVHQFSGQWIKKRRTTIEEDPSQLKKRHLDFLDILLTARDENGVGLTDQEIKDDVDTFMFEGHDITASAIMWAFYALAKYPDMQQKVRSELEELLDGRKELEYDDIPKLDFTTCFLKESMRMFSPVPYFNRQLTDPVSINGVIFPADTMVDIMPWVLHHNPAVWKNPSEFDPDRFLPENIAKKDPFAYLPFSAGQRFKISLDKTKEAVPFKEVVTSAKDGIYLHFQELI